MILELVVVGALAVNCYVVGSNKTLDAVVIDPGDDAHKIIAAIQRHNLNLKYIILTHGHFDHVGAAKALKEATGAHVLIHKSDEELLAHAESSAAMFGMKAPPSPKPDGYMKEGDAISFGDLSMTVIETPGHTPGGVSLYMKKQGVVFTGDTLFWGSIGRTDLPGGDYKAIMNSLKNKLAHLPDSTTVLCGHGDETSIGFEKEQNPYLD